MKTLNEITTEIQKLNSDYQNRVLNVTHKQYLKMYSKIKNQNSISNQVKDFGAKVKKEFSGYYIYEGVNFTVGFNEAACETVWWEVQLYGEVEADKVVFNHFEDWNQYDTKNEVVSALLELDRELQTA